MATTNTYAGDGITVTFTDFSGEILGMVLRANIRGLQACGIKGRAYAMKNLQENHNVDTEKLMRNISYAVDEKSKEVYIGTNVEYAIYVHEGTGIYYPGGRRVPWHYQDARGDWHTTTGAPGNPFLRKAAQDHTQEYWETLRDALTNI